MVSFKDYADGAGERARCGGAKADPEEQEQLQKINQPSEGELDTDLGSSFGIWEDWDDDQDERKKTFRFHLQQYMVCLVTTLINLYRYYRKIARKELARLFLGRAEQIANRIKKPKNIKLARICGMVCILQGNKYFEGQMCEDAIIRYERAFDYYVVAIKLFFEKVLQTSKEHLKLSTEQSLEKTVMEFIILLHNYSLACEQENNPSKMMECIRLAKWFRYFPPPPFSIWLRIPLLSDIPQRQAPAPEAFRE